MKLNLKPSTHRLIVNCLYLAVCLIFLIANLDLLVAGVDPLLLGLAFFGCSSLTLAGGIGVGRSLISIRNERIQQEQPVAETALIPLRPSTGGILFALNHANATMSFLLLDSLFSSPSDVRALRMSSTFLWLLYALSQGYLAVNVDRPRENNPNQVIPRPRINRSTINFALEIDFEIAAILLGISNLLARPSSTLKSIGVLLWMAACGMDIIKTHQELNNENISRPTPNPSVTITVAMGPTAP